MTRARTFCRDGLVGAAGGLDSSVLIDYDNDRLTTYSDTWDPPGSVGARGCALTFSLVSNSCVQNWRGSVTDRVVVSANERL